MTTRAGREAEFRELARDLEMATHAEDDGCVTYTFLQQQSDPRRFVVFEQWRDLDAVVAHLGRLVQVFGPPREGDALPARLMGYPEASDGVRYVPLT